MRMMVICNPGSGKQKISKKKGLIISSLQKKYDVTYYETKSLEDLINVTSLSKDYDYIVIVGGDGTFHHAINALTGYQGVIGYIPSGTSCDMAINFSTSKNTKKALKVILEGETREYKPLHFANLDVAYVAANGKFVSISYNTPRRAKKIGKLAYAFRIIPESFRKYKLNITIDGEKHSGQIMALLNTGCIFGFRFKPIKGKLLIMKHFIFWNMLKMAITKKIKPNKNVELIDVLDKEIICDFNIWSVDGEKYELDNRVMLNASSSFRVIMGKNK